MSTPFDAHFVDALEPYMPFYKIASADLTNGPLLRQIAKKNKPIILSTGAATLGEIESALSEIRSESDAQVALLHCVLSYPCDPRNANLETIRTLQRTFPGCIVGYSDHVPPAHESLCLTTAWLLGARIIEKHFTLDKGKPGNDHYHSFDPTDIRNFREACAYATEVFGQGQKKVLLCEEIPRLYARRSLVAARDVKQGDVIQAQDLAMKRPGTGIPPSYLDLIVGSRPIKDIGEDAVLQWDMFLNK
jgi:N-acetylneuraminate synthase